MGKKTADDVHDPNSVAEAIENHVDLEAELADDRGRGMLTQTDREFLAGEADDLGEQQTRNRRYKIRKRVESGIKDAMFLAKQSKKDRKMIFSKFRGGDRKYLVEFGIYVYQGLKDTGAGKRRLLIEVVEEAERREGNDVNVEITSTVGRSEYKEITMKVDPEDGDSSLPTEA